MKSFMDKDFLLETETAKTLYHDYAAKMPIIDYHCHINPAEIAGDKHYDSITEIWLGGDHYKWRLMRANGVPEEKVTGKGTDPYEIFAAWASTLPRAIGNPLYHWSYLELKKYFDVTTPLNEKTAKEIYDHCNAVLAKPEMGVQGIIEQSDVRLICTTDDPIDDLRYHEQIAADDSIKVKILPAFRPDKAMNVDKGGFADYIAQLAAVSGISIKTFADLKKALISRVDYFNDHGCKASDHALDGCIYSPATEAELDAILAEGLTKGNIDDVEKANQFRTAVLLLLSEKYAEYNWVMQLHFGCIRNLSAPMFEKLGADTGFDAAGDAKGAKELAGLLGAMDKGGHLPKMVLYSLNDNDNAMILTVAGCFAANSGVRNKIQLGSAWWFNDTKSGMEKQLRDFANASLLANFVGMLTDSRSFLSYTRHEYFRRILCNFLGNLVENGEYHNDMETLGRIVEDICYNNTKEFFGFDV